MSTLSVKKLDMADACENYKQAEILLENTTEKIAIQTLNWKDYSYLPKVYFKIAHTNNEIILKYYVKEKNPKAVEIQLNGDVYKDSCVEFFISPNSDGFYYNFEFNCIGIAHVGYGNNRFNRQLLDIDYVKKVKSVSSLGTKPLDLHNYDKEWTIFIVIPKKVMIHDKETNWNDLHAKSNFYKCGDETEEIHFVTWNPIKTSNPDYHRYEFFGDVVFQ